MAAMTPVATIAVLPLALFAWRHALDHGPRMEVHGDADVDDRRARPRVDGVRPAHDPDQMVGMAIVLVGLLGFVLRNQRMNLQTGTLAEPVSATEDFGAKA